MQLPMYSANPSVEPDAPFLRWSHLLNEGLAKGSIKAGAPNQFCEHLKEVGFKNVVEEKVEWGVGPWKEDEKGKRLGEMEAANMHSGLEGRTMGVLTTQLGWTQAQVEDFAMEVKRDIDDPKKQYFMIM